MLLHYFNRDTSLEIILVMFGIIQTTHHPYYQRRLGHVLFLQNRRTRITSATENEIKSKVYRHLSEHPCLREGFLPDYILSAHPSISLMLMCPEQMMMLGFIL